MKNHRPVALGLWRAALVLTSLMAPAAGAWAQTAVNPATEATPAAAMPAAGAGSAPMSPHARAARERALARPDTAASGIRVSPFTDRRKPHRPAGAP